MHLGPQPHLSKGAVQQGLRQQPGAGESPTSSARGGLICPVQLAKKHCLGDRPLHRAGPGGKVPPRTPIFSVSNPLTVLGPREGREGYRTEGCWGEGGSHPLSPGPLHKPPPADLPSTLPQWPARSSHRYPPNRVPGLLETSPSSPMHMEITFPLKSNHIR